MDSSLEHHLALAKGTEAEGLIRSEGCMYVYEDAKSLADEANTWDLRRARGTVVEKLDAGQIRERLPAFSPIF